MIQYHIYNPNLIPKPFHPHKVYNDLHSIVYFEDMYINID